MQLCSTWGRSTTEAHEKENPGHRAHGTAETQKVIFPFQAAAMLLHPLHGTILKVNLFTKKNLNSFINKQRLKVFGVYMKPLFITVHVS